MLSNWVLVASAFLSSFGFPCSSKGIHLENACAVLGPIFRGEVADFGVQYGVDWGIGDLDWVCPIPGSRLRPPVSSIDLLCISMG
jgi:hypothetical protein